MTFALWYGLCLVYILPINDTHFKMRHIHKIRIKFLFEYYILKWNSKGLTAKG